MTSQSDGTVPEDIKYSAYRKNGGYNDYTLHCFWHTGQLLAQYLLSNFITIK